MTSHEWVVQHWGFDGKQHPGFFVHKCDICKPLACETCLGLGHAMHSGCCGPRVSECHDCGGTGRKRDE